ncbi:MAG: SMC-Scp complex subunit ScpB, partial [Phycisphaerae bacterium]|nr:SMC-Scp complex subunit ScpB [Phycisphaerae bacterium]
MSIEHSDEQVEDVVYAGEAVEESVDDGKAVEVDADSLAAAAQSAGISDADTAKSEECEGFEKFEEADEAVVVAKGEEAEAGDGGASVKTEDAAAVEDAEDAEGDEDEEDEVEIVTSVCTDDGVEVTVESVVEAILFASDEPITPNRLVSIVETGSVKQVRDCVKSLNEKYEQNNLAFRIERIAGGYQMMTLDAYNHWLRKMIRVRADNKLTQAALETLAIVAYKQPIMRADVEGIRGVSSGEMIRSLMYKGLVRITGRAEVLGRPMLYGTTKKFLDVFGLNSPKDFPKL